MASLSIQELMMGARAHLREHVLVGDRMVEGECNWYYEGVYQTVVTYTLNLSDTSPYSNKELQLRAKNYSSVA